MMRLQTVPGRKGVERRTVVVTRPLEGAEETGRQLRVLGFEPVFAPLLRVVARPGPVPVPGNVAAVAMTSANAVPALPPSLRGLPVFAVGNATAAAARRSGCANVHSAEGNADDLARLIASAASGKVLVLSGAGQGEVLARNLRADGVPVVRRVAYAAHPVRRLPRQVLRLLETDEVHAIVFMSAATAIQFGHAVPAASLPALARVVAACISEPTAAAVRHLPWKQLRVSLKPNLPDTLALL